MTVWDVICNLANSDTYVEIHDPDVCLASGKYTDSDIRCYGDCDVDCFTWQHTNCLTIVIFSDEKRWW